MKYKATPRGRLRKTTFARYDLDGNLSSRSLNNSTHTDYAYDALDRVTWVLHYLNGTGRTFRHDYDNVGHRKWTKRDAGTGDVFGYDLNDQVTAVKLNVANPDTTAPGAQTIVYDANGNRTSFAAYGPPTQTYTINNLNQYTARTNSTSPLYDNTANMTRGVDNSTYVYDAQNRLTSATKGSVTMQFKYDGLNRQVSRAVVGGATTYNLWDGWDLVEEFLAPGAQQPVGAYLHGATGLVKNLVTDRYYYQDGSGSTSHLADTRGALLWWFRYDLQGAPIVYNSADVQISSNGFDLHLFTGQRWYSQLGLYDLRNRFYSPDIGRFLQPDPIGFRGDRSNLYRYCRNNPVKWSDPSGLERGTYWPLEGMASVPEVIVTAPTGNFLGPDGIAGPGDSAGGADAGGLPCGELGCVGGYNYIPVPRPPEDDQPESPSTPQPPPSNVPSQNPAPNPTGLADAEFTLEIAGIAVGAGENLLSGGGDLWLSNRGYYRPEFRGNQYVRGYGPVMRGIRVLRGAGLGFFAAQTAIAGIDLYHNPSSSNFQHQGLRLGVGVIAFAGLPGFVTATTFFVIDDTIGWENAVGSISIPPTDLIIAPNWGF